MNFKRRKIIFILLFITSLSVFAQKTNIDNFILTKMEQLHIPGFEAVAIKDGKVIWTGYYGYQNLEKKIPVTDQTIFEAASTSKTITAAAVMQLYSENKLKLDDDINKYLDFRVFNPDFPEYTITIAQLLRHRSSIDDNVDYLGQFWETNTGDPNIPLKVFIKDYFSTKGKNYNKEKNFYNYTPGSKSNYSNMGIALLGYLVERITGQNFEKYCRESIFRPLDMDNSGWFLKEIDSSKLAMPYSYSDSLKHNQPLGFGGFPDYPAGSLHTNVEQFSHFLLAWTQQGQWNGKSIFDEKAIHTLTPDEFGLGFYTWSQYATNKGELLYMHTGKAIGVSSFISFDPVRKKGLIFICNGDINEGKDWREIIDNLYNNVF
ncbi:MAG: class A beta-lactamase-related serine hydrolase [Chryseobacterium sp.]|nr:class A beta-lactamase-related serine hydrolase [Chryseobacterium sp.]